jgi:hypothetical protein
VFDNNHDKINDNALPEPSQPSQPSPTSDYPPKCYHCKFDMYENKEDYEAHYVLRHPGKTAYPGQADIGADNLEPQGMEWEV